MTLDSVPHLPQDRLVLLSSNDAFLHRIVAEQPYHVGKQQLLSLVHLAHPGTRLHTESIH